MTPLGAAFGSAGVPPEVAALDAAAVRVAVPFGGGEMVWRRWGRGEPVVLLHGGAGSWTHWLRNVDALVARGCSVCAPDLPGFGESDLPTDGHDADAMVEPVADALAQLLDDSPFDLVGFSFGGMVAGLLAARHPSRVKRLVLVGAPGLGLFAGGPNVALKQWRHLTDALERIDAHRHNLQALMLARPESVDDLAVALQAANATSERTSRRHLARSDVLLRALQTVTCPVFGIWGRDDALYRGRLAALEAALRSAPTFRTLTLVPDAGHWVPFERPQAFDAALIEALRTPDAPRTSSRPSRPTP